MDDMNYVVGRGRLFFNKFQTGTKTKTGRLYFGNTPALSTTQSEDTLDHYSSEGGIRVKDASISLQNDSSGTFQCDNIALDNLALWFRGERSSVFEAGTAVATGTVTFADVGDDGDTVTIDGIEITFVAATPTGMEVLIGGTAAETATNLANFVNENASALGVTATRAAAVVTLHASAPGAAGNAITLAKVGTDIAVGAATLAGGVDATETLTGVNLGRWYQLGVTADQPQGVHRLGLVSITGVSTDSYTVDADAGMIYLNPDASDIVDGDDLDVAYGLYAGTDDVVVAKSETIEGELAFIANNASGANDDYLWPYVRLSPDGDLPLKGDEWMTMNFNFEILKRDALTERQYITRRRAA